MNREQVLALRARGHGLAQRSPDAPLTGTIGLRSTKHRGLSVRARVAVAADALDRSLAAGDLVKVFGTRGSMMIVPAADLGIFTIGVAPDGEKSLIAALPGAFAHPLLEAGTTVGAALATVTDAVRRCLAAGALPRGELAQAVSARLPALLVPPCRGRCPDPHVEDSLFRLAGTFGAMHFVRDTDLLAAGPEFTDVAELRTEFTRRYLRCYGPSGSAALAELAGISRDDASSRLRALAGECPSDAARTVLAESLESTKRVTGVRFLPPYDPYLEDRDRATLLPDRAAQKTVWRALGGPGLLLLDGEPVATWKTRKREVHISAFRPGFRCAVDAEMHYMFGDVTARWAD